MKDYRVLLNRSIVGLCIFLGLFAAREKMIKRKLVTDNTVKIGFMGDIMLGRGIDEMISEFSKAGEENPWLYLWGDMLEVLKSTDFNVANLETTLTTSKNAVPKVFNFKSNPENVRALKEANIDVVNLANNHILDFSKEGATETLQVLDKAGIKHVGVGNNKNEAARGVIVEKSGARIGIIGFTDNEPGWEATKDKLGINYLEVGNVEKIRGQISELREKVDILVVSAHWGPNMREVPTKKFVNFAHAMIDAGADIIHGHSAHIVQGIETYREKLIMYDTGDFVDDYRVDLKLRNDLSFLFLVEVDTSGVKTVKLLPVLINMRQVNRVTGEERELIVERMKKLSKDFGTILEDDGEFLVLEKSE